MIVVDFNQTAISTLMAELAGRKSIEVNIDLVRHMIVNALRSYKKKFGAEYGEMVIACDNRQYWRKQYYPYYKASRKKAREDSGFDWNSIFEALNQIRNEIEEFFPYPVINVDGAEADDVIASLAAYSQTSNNDALFASSEPFLVLSGDHDFQQLQKWSNVKQYTPIQKKWITLTDKPEHVLMDHIIRGDKGDGIPNILSPDDIFVTKGRQSPLRQTLVDEWKTQEPAIFITNDVLWRNFQRNRELIDLSRAPPEISTAIIDQYHLLKSSSTKSMLLNYFIKYRMVNMMEVIGDF